MKIKEFIKNNSQLLLAVFCIFVLFQTCSEKRKIGKLEDKIENLEKATSNQLSQDEYLLIQKIETYKFLAENLYVNNAIIRTVIRPDDKLNEYNQKINELENQLESIRKTKKPSK